MTEMVRPVEVISKGEAFVTLRALEVFTLLDGEYLVVNYERGPARLRMAQFFEWPWKVRIGPERPSRGGFDELAPVF